MQRRYRRRPADYESRSGLDSRHWHQLQAQLRSELDGEHLQRDQAAAADGPGRGVRLPALAYGADELTRPDPAQRTGVVDGVRNESGDDETGRERHGWGHGARNIADRQDVNGHATMYPP